MTESCFAIQRLLMKKKIPVRVTTLSLPQFPYIRDYKVSIILIENGYTLDATKRI